MNRDKQATECVEAFRPLAETAQAVRRQMKQDRPQLYVIVEGGVVQELCSPTPEAFAGVNITVIDYDTDHSDEDCQLIDTGDGTKQEAIVRESLPICKAYIRL